MEKEKENPDFNFIFSQGIPENMYYRWKVYSLAQGDSQDLWRESPFQFSIGGKIWHPPQIIKYDHEDEEINKNKNSLKSNNMIINPNIQNGSIENFERKVEVKSDINDDEDSIKDDDIDDLKA